MEVSTNEVIHTEEQSRVQLTWNVYRYNFNSKRIETTNIFNHWRFEEDVKSDLCRRLTKGSFEERLRRNLMYYFWSKCEHEIIVSSWPYTEDAAAKIDVYQQVMMNWNIFLEYTWSFRKEVRSERKKNASRERRTTPPEEVKEEGAASRRPQA